MIYLAQCLLDVLDRTAEQGHFVERFGNREHGFGHRRHRLLVGYHEADQMADLGRANRKEVDGRGMVWPAGAAAA